MLREAKTKELLFPESVHVIISNSEIQTYRYNVFCRQYENEVCKDERHRW